MVVEERFPVEAECERLIPGDGKWASSLDSGGCDDDGDGDRDDDGDDEGDGERDDVGVGTSGMVTNGIDDVIVLVLVKFFSQVISQLRR